MPSAKQKKSGLSINEDPGSVAGSISRDKVGSVDQIVSEILKGLHEGRYVPGQKLVEADLTERFGVGRGTIREALRILEARGLTTTSMHRGARIRTFTRDGVRDMLEVTEIMAGVAGRWAAERLRSTDDAAALRSLIAELSRQIDAGERYLLARLRFSILEELVALSHNQDLRRQLPRFDASVIRAQFRSVFDINGARRELRQLEDVLTCIIARDGAGAEKSMRAFIRDSAAAILSLPDDQFTN